MNLLYSEIPGLKIEVLVPDFKGDIEALKVVVGACPTVLGHNLETVPRLYPAVRPMADYRRSLDLLARVKDIDPEMVTKSGIMLGLGEEMSEVLQVMRDLREVGCDLLTLGQYLAPAKFSHPIVRYVTPEDFEEYIPAGLDMGFRGVASAPLMRSSYKADEFYREAIEKCPSDQFPKI